MSLQYTDPSGRGTVAISGELPSIRGLSKDSKAVKAPEQPKPKPRAASLVNENDT